MVDQTGSGRSAEINARLAALAAVRSYRSIYGYTLGRDTIPVMDALCNFWLDRFREGRPTPEWFRPEEDEQAPAASEVVPSPPGAS